MSATSHLVRRSAVSRGANCQPGNNVFSGGTSMEDALSIPRPFSAHLTVIARAVSDILSPAALSIPCMLLGVLASDVPGTYRFALLYFLVAIPVPVAYVMWLVKSGRVSDFHLPNRRDRTGPFLVS